MKDWFKGGKPVASKPSAGLITSVPRPVRFTVVISGVLPCRQVEEISRFLDGAISYSPRLHSVVDQFEYGFNEIDNEKENKDGASSTEPATGPRLVIPATDEGSERPSGEG